MSSLNHLGVVGFLGTLVIVEFVDTTVVSSSTSALTHASRR